MDSLKRQEGGTHYKDMAIQPWYFCYKNHYTPQSYVVKYLVRVKNDPNEDRRKAKHCLELWRDSYETQEYKNLIPVEDFITENNIIDTLVINVLKLICRRFVSIRDIEAAIQEFEDCGN